MSTDIRAAFYQVMSIERAREIVAERDQEARQFLEANADNFNVDQSAVQKFSFTPDNFDEAEALLRAAKGTRS